jgi:integrase
MTDSSTSTKQAASTGKWVKTTEPCIRVYEQPVKVGATNDNGKPKLNKHGKQPKVNKRTWHVAVKGTLAGVQRRYLKSFPYKNAAIQWRNETKSQLAQGIDPQPDDSAHKPAGPHTLADEIHVNIRKREQGLYTESKATGLDKELGKDTRRHLQWWSESPYGGITLTELTRDDLLEAKAELVANGGKAPRTPATVNRYMAALSGVLSAAAAKGQIGRFVFRSKSLPENENLMFKEGAGRERFLDDAEIVRLVYACKNTGTEIWAVVVLALETGARAGEILGLQRADIDLDEGTALARNTKNGDHRLLPIHSTRAKQAVRLMSLKTEMYFCPIDRHDKPDPRLFGSWHYRNDWATAKKVAGLEAALRFHDLRHTFASHLHNHAEAPVNLDDLANILGHRSGSVMTKRYAHADEERLNTIVRTQGIFAGSGGGND